MQSFHYPCALFVENTTSSLMTNCMPQDKSIAILHPRDPLLTTYTAVAQQIFAQISITSEELWIGRVKGASQVRIFFAEPEQYPVGKCCRAPLFLELNPDFSGAIQCTQCLKVKHRFVHSTEESASEAHIFREQLRVTRRRKQNLKEQFISHKFRSHKLRDNFFKADPASLPKGSFIVQISQEEFAEEQENESATEEQLSGNLQELHQIISDIFS